MSFLLTEVGSPWCPQRGILMMINDKHFLKKLKIKIPLDRNISTLSIKIFRYIKSGDIIHVCGFVIIIIKTFQFLLLYECTFILATTLMYDCPN